MKRTHLWLILGALALGLLGLLASLTLLRGPAGPYGAQPPAAVTGPAPAPTPPAATPEPPAKPAEPEAAPSGDKASEKPAPLPPLVPGNPLNDEQFAAVSAQIVIAAMGLKQDKDWEANLNAYIGQELAKAKITEEQFMEYRDALHANQERGPAVAENIMRKVQKRLGYRLEIEKLPMFSFDPAQKQELEKRLKRK